MPGYRAARSLPLGARIRALPSAASVDVTKSTTVAIDSPDPSWGWLTRGRWRRVSDQAVWLSFLKQTDQPAPKVHDRLRVLAHSPCLRRPVLSPAFASFSRVFRRGITEIRVGPPLLRVTQVGTPPAVRSPSDKRTGSGRGAALRTSLLALWQITHRVNRQQKASSTSRHGTTR